jgi:hypothetical protein
MRRNLGLGTLTALCGITLAACSGNATTVGGTSPSPTVAHYPAFKPAVPQLQKGSLAVIAEPVLVPVHYSGDAMAPALDAALRSWTTSPSFGALGEYGVHSATVELPVYYTSGIPPNPTSEQIQAWVEQQLDGSNPLFGPVDAKTLASKIFVGFTGPGDKITYGNAVSCVDFASYDAGVTLASGAVAHYVVVPRCSPPLGVSQTDGVALAAISSVIDRIGSPTPSLTSSASGWAAFDPSHGGFALGGEGLAGACSRSVVGSDPVGIAGQPVSWPANGLPLVPRVWSNAAASGYGDPCVPASSPDYFVSVPVATDQVTLPTGGVSTGVLVPAGGSRTIDVQLLSDKPTGDWWVSTQLLDIGLPRGGTSDYGFSWDKPTGNDGDTLHLTISAPSPSRKDVVIIYSTRDQRQTYWLLPLQSE